MTEATKKTRMQIPVSAEFAAEVTALGKCLGWGQGQMAAALLEEGWKDREQLEQWILASVVNTFRGKRKVRATGDNVVWLQTAIDAKVVTGIERMAGEMHNTPARVAAMLLERAGWDNGWIIEALGTGPGQALGKFIAGRPKKRTSPGAEMPASSS